MNRKYIFGSVGAIVLLILAGYFIFQKQNQPKEVSVNLADPFADLVVFTSEDPATQSIYDEKVSLTKQAWQEKPDIWETWIAIGNLYVFFQQYEEGIAAYEQSIVAHSNIVGHRNIATVYARDLQQYKKAEEYYRLALKDDFSDETLYINLAQLQRIHLNDPKAAEETLREGLSRAGNKQDILVQLIVLYGVTGETDKQKETVKELLDRFPEEQYKKAWGYLLQ